MLLFLTYLACPHRKISSHLTSETLKLVNWIAAVSPAYIHPLSNSSNLSRLYPASLVSLLFSRFSHLPRKPPPMPPTSRHCFFFYPLAPLMFQRSHYWCFDARSCAFLSLFAASPATSSRQYARNFEKFHSEINFELNLTWACA